MNELRDEFTRRRALVATSVIAGAGLLAACGDGDSATATKSVDARVQAADVPVGGGFVDKTTSVVVTQPTKGTFKAFSSVCPHQGCQVGSVSTEAIVCPCHGSRFDPSTGEVTAGPAQKGLSAKRVDVQGDALHITG